MAYSTTAQVASEFKDITFNATSAVTDTEVDRFIEEADAEIDGRVGKRYEVPVTGTASLKILRTISIGIVADRIRDILELKNPTMPELEQGIRPKSSAAKARKMLEQISKGDLLLSDATLANAHMGMKSFAVDEGLEYEYQSGVPQW
jgi:phage gp36-like protein